MPKRDFSVAMRMSQRAESCMPPANAYPSTAAMTGFRHSVDLCDPFLACEVAPVRSRSVSSFRSAPAQKARPPTEVTATTNTSSSSMASPNAYHRPFCIPVLSAFIRSGLLSVIQATRSFTS